VIDRDLFFYSNHPEGTKDSPFSLGVGETVGFNVSATCHCINTATNEELWAIYGEWEAKVQVNEATEYWELGAWVMASSLTYVTGDTGYKWKGGTRYWCYFYVFDGVSWTPEAVGNYIVTFFVHVYEGYGAERSYVGLVEKAVYVQVVESTPEEPVPDGYFTVEDVDTRTVTIVICHDGVVDFEFLATDNGDVVDEVYVEVYRGESLVVTVYLTEVEADFKWEGSWGAKPGTYELRGYIRYDDATSRLMTLLVSFEPEEAPPWVGVPMPSLLDGVGVICLIAGIYLLVRWWRRRRTLG